MAPGRSRQPRLAVVSVAAPNNVAASVPEPATNNPNNTTEGPGSATTKKVRGKNRGLGLNKHYRANGKVKVNIPQGKNRPVGAHSSNLAREIGIIVRQCAPLMVNGWKEISSEDKDVIYARVMEKLDLETELPHVQDCLADLAQDRYKDFRCYLHKEYKKAGGGESARAKPPIELIDRPDEWNWLCDHFETEKFKRRSSAGTENRGKLKFVHRRGSQTFVAAQEQLKCDRVELYRHAYHGENGWAHEDAQATYDQMKTLKENPVVEGEAALTDDQICTQVLGTRSGYVPGYGRGPKPPPRSRPTTESSYNSLQEELTTTKEELSTTKKELASAKEELADTKIQLAAQDKKIDWLIQQLVPGQQPPGL